jgi:HK97 family phage major capsid protein
MIIRPCARSRGQAIGTAGFTKLFNSRGMGSGWVGETAARPETTAPTFGTLTFTPGEIYANPSATQGLLDDSQGRHRAFIADNVETEFAYQEGIAFVSGNGTNKPYGFLTFATGAANAAVHPWGAIAVTTAAGTGGDDRRGARPHLLAPRRPTPDNARFVMNRTSLFGIRKLKDTTGQYLWQPSRRPASRQTIARLPGHGNGGDADHDRRRDPDRLRRLPRGYLIVDRIGVRVLRDPYTNKPYVMFYTTKRVGGGLLNPDAIKVLKMPPKAIPAQGALN